MSRSKIFLYFCLSFIAGVFIGSLGILTPHLYIGGGLILAVLLVSLFWKYRKIAVVGFCLIFLVLGVYRTKQAQRTPQFKEGEVTLTGTVIKEPDIRDRSIKLTVEVESFGSPAQILQSKTWAGKVLVTTTRYPEYDYGDKLKITGHLEVPEELPDFNYQGYLAKDGIFAVIYWPEIELLAKNQGNFVYAKLLQFKNKLRESIEQNLSPPQSSILGAVLLGDKQLISEEWKQKLNITGVRHITCISGMHIVILSWILMWLGIRLGLWRGQAFYFAIISLTLFIVMVGAPASAVRAGIMGGLLLLAQRVGRLRQGGRALVIAAAFMLVQNPLLLKFDVGFQLSFLATLGIIYLMPIFQPYLGSLISMTLAAQVFTLPILIYNFGYFSLVAPLTNVLFVPLIPYIMSAGLVLVFAGLIWDTLAWVLSWPVWLFLSYGLKIVDWFSQLPLAYLNLKISWPWLILSYLILAGITAWLVHRQRWKFLEY